MLERLYVFVHGDALLHFSRIILSKIRMIGASQNRTRLLKD